MVFLKAEHVIFLGSVWHTLNHTELALLLLDTHTFFFVLVLWTKPRTLHLVDKCRITPLNPHPALGFYYFICLAVLPAGIAEMCHHNYFSGFNRTALA